MNIIPDRRVKIRIFTIYHPPLYIGNKRKIPPNAAAEIDKPSRAIYINILTPSNNINAYMHTFKIDFHIIV